MKVLAIGDPHFKSDNAEMTSEMGEKVVKLIIKESPDIVVVLGDILHRHEKIDLHPMHRAIHFLKSIHDAIPKTSWLYVIIGNHDRSSNRVYMNDEHAFNGLKKWRHTLVVDHAMTHEPIPDRKVLLVPYVPTGRFEEAWKTATDNLDDITLVMAHQEFAGAKMNAITSHEGDPWDQENPLCISGHIHDYDRLQSNLIYVGTPIQHSFGDMAKKSVSFFEFKEGSKEYSHKKICLKIRGKTSYTGKIVDYTDLLKSAKPDLYDIKFRLSGTRQEIKNFSKSIDYLRGVEEGYTFQFMENIIKEPERQGECDDDEQALSSGVDFKTRIYSVLTDKEKVLLDQILE